MMEKLLSNTQTSFDDIRESYARICENIEKAKAAAGRADEVRLMAVTKTVSPERINYAVGLGVDLLGENRVQEFMDKREQYLPAEVHFIGGLQTNKVKYIIDKVSMIHSVDSTHLAEEISRRAVQHGLVMDILAEINIGGEETKGGITPESAPEFCAMLRELPGVRLKGLMTIPPPGCGEDAFAAMHRLFCDLRSDKSVNDAGTFDTLSMGMSGDYETAVKHGSTIIRIGSGLFGYRKYL
ncbi:MAG: YggS family pyridoxal phosphate-dependent enzyme [Oscillospiraceae bacterium]